MDLLRVLLIGESQVGKTSILTRFVKQKYEESPTTIGVDFQVRHFETKHGKIKLQLWDTAGQERFHTITLAYFRGADIIGLVYDVHETNPYKALDYWYERIRAVRPDISIILVGNKADEIRPLCPKATQWARSHNMEYLECSAKNNLNIDSLFLKMIEMPRPRVQPPIPLLPPPVTPSPCCPIG